MDNLIGKIVCGYRIISEVGVGGMGKVYLAESAFLTEYKQQVAVKTLTTQASTERQAALLRDLFTREAGRMEIRGIVGSVRGCPADSSKFKLVASLEVFNNNEGRTVFMVPSVR